MQNVAPQGSSRGAMTATLKRVLIAVGLVGVIVLVGILIKITNKDGSVTEIKVPDGAKVEVVDGGEPEAVRPRTHSETPDVRGLTPPGSPGSNQKSKIENQKSLDPDRAAAEWVLSLKGLVPPQVRIQLSGESESRTVNASEALPLEPFQVRAIMIRGLKPSSRLTDGDVARYIEPLRRLDGLWLQDCPDVTDVSQPVISRLTTLRSLNVFQTKLTGPACLELAKSLPELFAISVGTNQFTDELAEFIGATPRPTYVGVYGGTDAQLRQLLNAKQMETLVFAGGFEGRRASAELSTWRELPDRLPNLTNLHLTSAVITDAHLAEFARLPKLRVLGAGNTPITDAGLKSLQACQTLRRLDVSATNVTSDGVNALHAALPHCRITHPGGVLEPK
jgi:hypothetical protein